MDNKNVNDIDNSVKAYFEFLRGFKPLTKEEEHNLIKKYRNNNDINARNAVINSNLRFACKIASAYRGRGVSYSDLISEANDGLIESIDRFDLEKDVKVFSYARWWIKQRLEAIFDNRKKMPLNDLPDENNTQLLSNDNDYFINEKNDDNSFFIFEDNSDDISNTNISNMLDEITKSLDEREIDIINMYYGRKCEGDKSSNLEEIGEKYHITKERVRQIIEKAFKKIRTEAMIKEILV